LAVTDWRLCFLAFTQLPLHDNIILPLQAERFGGEEARFARSQPPRLDATPAERLQSQIMTITKKYEE